MKLPIVFLSLIVSSLIVSPYAYSQGEIKGQPPVDPGAQQISGSLRVVPVTGDGSKQTDYCRLGAKGTLIIRLVNVGKTPTQPQRVEVTFGSTPPTVRTVTTPKVSGGQRTDVSVPIPANCAKPDCGFSIKVADQKPVAGFCVG